jgi:predicted Zn-dependent protease
LIVIALLTCWATAALGLFPAPGKAYNLESCHWTHPESLTYYSSSSYKKAINNAITYWNVIRSPVLITKGTYANNEIHIINTDRGADGEDGETFLFPIGCRDGSASPPILTHANSSENTHYTDHYSGYARTETMVHELGHALGLAHAGQYACAGQPIMWPNRYRWYRCHHYRPQEDDIAGIHAIYG